MSLHRADVGRPIAAAIVLDARDALGEGRGTPAPCRTLEREAK
jgi:hypothetical protein